MHLLQFIFWTILPGFYSDEIPEASLTGDQKHTEISDLQGLWMHKKLTQDFENCRGFVSEEIISPLYGTPDLYFENDTMWTFRYPCRLYEKIPFHVKSDSLYVYGNTVAFACLQLKNNSLIVTFKNCAQHSFERGTADPGIINILKRDTINGSCLLGRYQITTHFEPGDEASFDHVSPVKMPEYLEITSSQLAKIKKQHMITLKMKNKDRLFHVSQIDFYGFYPHVKTRFILTPASWWKGEFFDVFYMQQE